MKKVQMNLQVPIDVKEFIYAQAKEDDRHPAYMLEKLIRPMMEGVSPRPHPTSPPAHFGQLVVGDSHTQQSLIPKIDKTGGFDEFWAAYPKKKAKADALKAWTKNECWKISGSIFADVNDRVSNDPSWSDKQFVPNGATYLNGKRWEDEIIQQDNRPAFEKQGDALRDELFGNDGATYEHE